MKVGGIKLRATAKRPLPNIGKLVAKATTKVKGPVAGATKGLPTGPKPPRLK